MFSLLSNCMFSRCFFPKNTFKEELKEKIAEVDRKKKEECSKDVKKIDRKISYLDDPKKEEEKLTKPKSDFHFVKPNSTQIRDLDFSQKSITNLIAISPDKSRENILKRAVYTINDFYEYANKRYGDFGIELINKLESIAPQMKILSVDPCVAFHIDGFKKFAKKHKDIEDPWELRQAFSDSLGTKEVYRAICLDDKQADKVRSLGMLSQSIRLNQEKLDVSSIKVNLQDIFLDRIFEIIKPEKDELVSVTDFRQLALYVSDRYKTKDSKIFLAKCRVPKFSLLYSSKKGNILKVKKPIKKEVESFIHLSIQPNEILEFKQVEPTKEDLRVGELIAAFAK